MNLGTTRATVAIPDFFDVMNAEAHPVPARFLLHQEGLFGLLAVVGIGFQDIDPLSPFTARPHVMTSLAVGFGFGLACAAILYILRHLEPLKELENWQQILVSDWSVADVIAVALLSGLAEEALLRAFLQPLVGLLPAAVVFALLHILPDRRLWFWPVMALVIGICLGFLYDAYGFPAVAVAHCILNGVGLMRLQQITGKKSNNSVE